MYDNLIVPSNQITIIGAFSLLIEHKERYDIIIGEERYIFVLQQVPRDSLPCHHVSVKGTPHSSGGIQ